MTSAIKIPSRDIVNIQPQSVNVAAMEQFLFQDIGGTSLINLVRHDTISGINLSYSTILNLKKIAIDFDPSLLLINKASYKSIFDQYSIKLVSKVPQDKFYSRNELLPPSNLLTNVYFDGENLVIEFENIKQTEFVELQIETDGKINSVRENDY
jgi:hypothetical protein